MKRKIIRHLAVPFLLVFTLPAPAQNTGISLSIFNVGVYGKSSPFTQGFMGIGLERNVGDHIALKFEVNKGFLTMYSLTKGRILTAFEYNLEKSFSYYDQSTGYIKDCYYHWTIPIGYELNYQSRFFFSGNDKAGAYLAMALGMRSVKYVFHVGRIDEDSSAEGVPDDVQSRDKSSYSVVMFPLMLRFGIRGDLKGFYPDFSMGIGYNIGHNNEIKDNTLKGKYNLDVPDLLGISINAGISFGIGW